MQTSNHPTPPFETSVHVEQHPSFWQWMEYTMTIGRLIQVSSESEVLVRDMFKEHWRTVVRLLDEN